MSNKIQQDKKRFEYMNTAIENLDPFRSPEYWIYWVTCTKSKYTLELRSYSWKLIPHDLKEHRCSPNHTFFLTKNHVPMTTENHSCFEIEQLSRHLGTQNFKIPLEFTIALTSSHWEGMFA